MLLFIFSHWRMLFCLLFLLVITSSTSGVQKYWFQYSVSMGADFLLVNRSRTIGPKVPRRKCLLFHAFLKGCSIQMLMTKWVCLAYDIFMNHEPLPSCRNSCNIFTESTVQYEERTLLICTVLVLTVLNSYLMSILRTGRYLYCTAVLSPTI